jgi:hypothetical protein
VEQQQKLINDINDLKEKLNNLKPKPQPGPKPTPAPSSEPVPGSSPQLQHVPSPKSVQQIMTESDLRAKLSKLKLSEYHCDVSEVDGTFVDKIKTDLKTYNEEVYIKVQQGKKDLYWKINLAGTDLSFNKANNLPAAPTSYKVY